MNHIQIQISKGAIAMHLAFEKLIYIVKATPRKRCNLIRLTKITTTPLTYLFIIAEVFAVLRLARQAVLIFNQQLLSRKFLYVMNLIEFIVQMCYAIAKLEKPKLYKNNVGLTTTATRKFKLQCISTIIDNLASVKENEYSNFIPRDLSSTLLKFWHALLKSA